MLEVTPITMVLRTDTAPTTTPHSQMDGTRSTTMASSDVIVLYDIPDANKAPRSPNTWKARYDLSAAVYGVLIVLNLCVQIRSQLQRNPIQDRVGRSSREALCLKIGGPPTSKKPDGRPLYEDRRLARRQMEKDR